MQEKVAPPIPAPELISLPTTVDTDTLTHPWVPDDTKQIRVAIWQRQWNGEQIHNQIMVSNSEEIPECQLTETQSYFWQRQKPNKGVRQAHLKIREAVKEMYAGVWEDIIDSTIEEGNIVHGEYIYHIRTVTSAETILQRSNSFKDLQCLPQEQIKAIQDVYQKTYQRSETTTITANTILSKFVHIRLARTAGLEPRMYAVATKFIREGQIIDNLCKYGEETTRETFEHHAKQLQEGAYDGRLFYTWDEASYCHRYYTHQASNEDQLSSVAWYMTQAKHANPNVIIYSGGDVIASQDIWRREVISADFDRQEPHQLEHITTVIDSEVSTADHVSVTATPPVETYVEATADTDSQPAPMQTADITDQLYETTVAKLESMEGMSSESATTFLDDYYKLYKHDLSPCYQNTKIFRNFCLAICALEDRQQRREQNNTDNTIQDAILEWDSNFERHRGVKITIPTSTVLACKSVPVEDSELSILCPRGDGDTEGSHREPERQQIPTMIQTRNVQGENTILYAKVTDKEVLEAPDLNKADITPIWQSTMAMRTKSAIQDVFVKKTKECSKLLNLIRGVGKNEIITKTHLHEKEWERTLSESQQEAVNTIIGCVGTPAKVIHRIEGPPGCGKSKTTAELVARIIYELRCSGRRGKVAVMTPTNKTAEDNIEALSKITMPDSKHLKATWTAARQQVDRILSNAGQYITANLAVNNPDPTTYNDAYSDRGLMNILRKLHDKRSKTTLSTEEQSRYKTLHKQAVKRVFLDMDVIVSTACQLGIEIMRSPDIKWEAVIVEEASMHTEIATMLAIRLYPKQLILIGDSKQLPARQLSEEAQKYKLCPLFNRLYSHPYNKIVSTSMLKEHKRMPKAIAKIISELFYDDELTYDNSIEANKLEINTAYDIWSDPEKPVVIIDSTDTVESKEGTSPKNDKEAMKCLEVAWKILEKAQTLEAKDIGIVTMFKGQAAEITRCLTHFNDKLASIQISTVDKWQGSEAEIIIFSAVKTKTIKNQLRGFIAVPERICVACSRSTQGLIIIGCKDALCTVPIWRRTIEIIDGYDTKLKIHLNDQDLAINCISTRCKDCGEYRPDIDTPYMFECTKQVRVKYILRTQGYDRGAFAEKAFNKGDIIQCAQPSQLRELEEHEENAYAWEQFAPNKHSALTSVLFAVNEPAPGQRINVVITCDERNRTLTMHAIRNIQPGDELLTYYGESWDDHRGYEIDDRASRDHDKFFTAKVRWKPNIEVRWINQKDPALKGALNTSASPLSDPLPQYLMDQDTSYTLSAETSIAIMANIQALEFNEPVQYSRWIKIIVQTVYRACTNTTGNMWGTREVTFKSIQKQDTPLFLMNPNQQQLCSQMHATARHLVNLLHELRHHVRDKTNSMDPEDSTRTTPYGDLMEKPTTQHLIWRSKQINHTLVQRAMARLAGSTPGGNNNDLDTEDRWIIASHIAGDPNSASYTDLADKQFQQMADNKLLQRLYQITIKKIDTTCDKFSLASKDSQKMKTLQARTRDTSNSSFACARNLSIDEEQSINWRRIIGRKHPNFHTKHYWLQSQMYDGDPINALEYAIMLLNGQGIKELTAPSILSALNILKKLKDSGCNKAKWTLTRMVSTIPTLTNIPQRCRELKDLLQNILQTDQECKAGAYNKWHKEEWLLDTEKERAHGILQDIHRMRIELSRGKDDDNLKWPLQWYPTERQWSEGGFNTWTVYASGTSETAPLHDIIKDESDMHTQKMLHEQGLDMMFKSYMARIHVLECPHTLSNQRIQSMYEESDRSLKDLINCTKEYVEAQTMHRTLTATAKLWIQRNTALEDISSGTTLQITRPQFQQVWSDTVRRLKQKGELPDGWYNNKQETNHNNSTITVHNDRNNFMREVRTTLLTHHKHAFKDTNTRSHVARTLYNWETNDRGVHITRTINTKLQPLPFKHVVLRAWRVREAYGDPTLQERGINHYDLKTGMLLKAKHPCPDGIYWNMDKHGKKHGKEIQTGDPFEIGKSTNDEDTGELCTIEDQQIQKQEPFTVNITDEGQPYVAEILIIHGNHTALSDRATQIKFEETLSNNIDKMIKSNQITLHDPHVPLPDEQIQLPDGGDNKNNDEEHERLLNIESPSVEGRVGYQGDDTVEEPTQRYQGEDVTKEPTQTPQTYEEIDEKENTNPVEYTQTELEEPQTEVHLDTLEEPKGAKSIEDHLAALNEEFQNDISQTPTIHFEDIPEDLDIYQNILILYSDKPLYAFSETWTCHKRKETNRATHTDMLQYIGEETVDIFGTLWMEPHANGTELRCTNGFRPSFSYHTGEEKRKHPAGKAGICSVHVDPKENLTLWRHCRWKRRELVASTGSIKHYRMSMCDFIKEKITLKGTMKATNRMSWITNVNTETYIDAICNGQMAGLFSLASKSDTPNAIGTTQYYNTKLWEIQNTLCGGSTHNSHKQIEEKFRNKIKTFLDGIPPGKIDTFQEHLTQQLKKMGKKKEKAIARIVSLWTSQPPGSEKEQEILMLLNHTISRLDGKLTNLHKIKKENPVICFLLMAKIGYISPKNEDIQAATDLWNTLNQ